METLLNLKVWIRRPQVFNALFKTMRRMARCCSDACRSALPRRHGVS